MARKKTQEEFEQEVFKKHENNFKVIGTYINGRTKIKLRHICGYEFETRPDVILNAKNGNGCPRCSNIHIGKIYGAIWDTKPEIAELLVNYHDGHRLTRYSKESVEFKCPDCGHVQSRMPKTIISNGFICERCSDGFSKPEKFMRSVLIQLGIDFEMQSKFKWAKNKKYDFFFDGIICETHGLQHYEHGFQCRNARSLEEERTNDEYKKRVALENGFTNDTYITIDCRKSEKQWIMNSILNSKLADYYNLSIIDWDKCEKDCLTSIMLDVCNLWNNGKTTTEIKKIMHFSAKTSVVSKYLKTCNSMGLCEYNPSESRKDASRHKVVCLNNGKIFNSIKDAQNFYNVDNISGCCIGQCSSVGRDPITNEKLVWRHYEDYLKLTENEIYNLVHKRIASAKRVICLNTQQVFTCSEEAGKWINRKGGSTISSCCRGEQETAGVHLITGEKLKWMYYDDYLKSTAS